MKNTFFLLLMLLLLVPPAAKGDVFPLSFSDAAGQKITLLQQPSRVVSLVPSVSEIILRIGAEKNLVATTYHSVVSPGSTSALIGGFFNPDLERVISLQPEVIFYSSLHREKVKALTGNVILIELAPSSMKEAFAQIILLGRMFGQEDAARKIVAEEQQALELVAEKVNGISPENRQRVMRLMGIKSGQVTTPGDDSFQQAFIRAAGGKPPHMGKNGNAVAMELEAWQAYNPQVLYGCGDMKGLRQFLQQPGWKEVEAVQTNRIFSFPCELTCRAASHSGFFVSWLAARVYREEFSEPATFVLPQQVVRRRSVTLDLNYVEKAEIFDSDIKDFRNKTLVLTLKEPMAVLSSLEGARQQITTVANHYFPPPSWGLGHGQGVGALRQDTLAALDLQADTTAMLFTGADMDNLAVIKKQYREMEVVALVTAGVGSNAMRMSKDSGLFYEPEEHDNSKPGTINTLLLTNMQLSQRAMTRALITATEAKTAALQDLDIRSGYSASRHQATGTGTDNIIVVQGRGGSIDAAGGHTRMGELIAAAVYDGVQEAVWQQNLLHGKRSVFKRMEERGMSLYALCQQVDPQGQVAPLLGEMEALLLEEKYSDFLKALFSLSDSFESSLVQDTASVATWAQAIASEIAGRDIKLLEYTFAGQTKIITLGLNALFTGAQARLQ